MRTARGNRPDRTPHRAAQSRHQFRPRRRPRHRSVRGRDERGRTHDDGLRGERNGRKRRRLGIFPRSSLEGGHLAGGGFLLRDLAIARLTDGGFAGSSFPGGGLTSSSPARIVTRLIVVRFGLMVRRVQRARSVPPRPPRLPLWPRASPHESAERPAPRGDRRQYSYGSPGSSIATTSVGSIRSFPSASAAHGPGDLDPLSGRRVVIRIDVDRECGGLRVDHGSA